MMGPSRAIIFVALFFIGSGRSSKWNSFRRNKKLDGYNCATNALSFENSYKSKTGCGARCVSSYTCLSVFYNPTTYRCFGCNVWYNDKEINGTLSGSDYCENDVCPDGTLFKRKRSCYFPGPYGLTFDQASKHCEEKDAHLFQAETRAENEFLKTYHSKQGLGFSIWYGLTDREEEGVWKWYSSGELISYSDWEEGPSGDYKAKDCVVLTGGNKWADRKCFLKNQDYATLCEKEI